MRQYLCVSGDQAGQSARTTSNLEARGSDGRGFEGPGLDHGVFVPFRLMFGEEFTDIPIVQVSIDSSMSPEKNWALGAAVSKLRYVVMRARTTDDDVDSGEREY